MNIKIFNIFKRKRYCPKCNVEMERVKATKLSIVPKHRTYQCPKCKSFLLSK